MEKNNKNNNSGIYVILGVLCVAVLALSISYAALSSTLNINFGNVSQTVQQWKVAFKPGTVTGSQLGTSTTGLVCGAATVTEDTVTVANSTISKPGDGCVYELTVENSGSIDANLATITPKNPTEVTCTESGASLVCGNITYKLTTDLAGQNLLSTNTVLEKQDNVKIYLSAIYTGANLAETNIIQNGAGFTLVYNQA